MEKDEITDSKTSMEILVALAIELPFWIPLKSGFYNLPKDRTLKIRNDLWMVSTGNTVDEPTGKFSDHIVNEDQVADDSHLEQLAGDDPRYFHKRKMKTTFTRSFSVPLAIGDIKADHLSEVWMQQIRRLVFGFLQKQEWLEGLLEDVNTFIDFYSSLVNPQNPSREIRRVSFFETMVNVRIVVFKKGQPYAEFIEKVSPDWATIELPFPAFRVTNHERLNDFKDTIVGLAPPEFHQIQWIKALNDRREKQYQEALIHAAITLESLVHMHLSALGYSKTQQKSIITGAKGIAGWLEDLQHKRLADACNDAARLWRLRNHVVHNQKVLTKRDKETIHRGIDSIALVRMFLLQTGRPEVLSLETRFTDFLERIELGKAVDREVGKMVPMRFGWRREKDCYRTIVDTEP
jgi:hypothetical protein